MQQLPPVLLTSSVIAMDHSVALRDPGQRIGYTLESIEQWLEVDAGLRLVICDGSGYDFSEIVESKFPNRSIECLHFENDQQLVERHGKGFGEGEIIKHALAHSRSLKNADWFAKCTAKLWVDNFGQCLSEWNDFFLCKAFFSDVFSLKKTKLEYVDTRFYLANKDVYSNYFLEAHSDVGGPGGLSIEDKFKKVLLQNDMKKVLFKSPLVISGVGGGSGKYYKSNLKRRIKESLRSRMVRSNPSFSRLFNS